MPGEFEGGDDTDIGLSGDDQVSTFGGNAKQQVEETLLGPMEHSPHQRGGIQIADRANPQPFRGGLNQALV